MYFPSYSCAIFEYSQNKYRESRGSITIARHTIAKKFTKSLSRFYRERGFLSSSPPSLSFSVAFSSSQYFCVETFSTRRHTDILYRRSMDLNFLSSPLFARKKNPPLAPRPACRKRIRRQSRQERRMAGLAEQGKRKQARKRKEEEEEEKGVERSSG